MNELNQDFVGKDLENLFKNQKETEEQQELERRRIQDLINLNRSQYYLKFKQKYQDIIKPCFDQFLKSFETYGHKLILKNENLDEMYVQPEVKYDLLVKGNERDIVQIYIFGKGRNENILFY